MTDLSRRDLLKSGLASVSAGYILPAFDRLAPMTAAAAPTPETSASTPQSGLPARERLLMNFGWQFALGNANDLARDFNFGQGSAFAKSGSFAAAARANFNDSAWQSINLPHDWVVDLPFNPARQLNEHGAKPLGRAYPDTSIGWYRRTFPIPVSDLGRRISIEFDGVYRDSIMMLNGHYVGRHLDGYAPFRFDVTDFLNYGGDNVLVVRVDATEYEGWFYEGAGIYRHVWLHKTEPVHVSHGGVFVASAVRAGSATLTISTEVENALDTSATCVVSSVVQDAAGRTVASMRSNGIAVPSRATREVKQQVRVANPALWSIESPAMYTLVTTIQRGTKTIDEYETPFGIRSIRHDPDRGFFLNGKSVKVKGTCNHQDHAGVGSALPDRLQFYRIERLKAMGSNAYRTSHNPPTPALLDACDQLGMLVMDETRTMSSNPDALADLEAMVRRDRNHPSVIWWSIGNEEPEQGTDRGARIAQTMKALIQRLDPTRPITEAMNNANSWGKGSALVLDVQGFNYNDGKIDDYHTRFPKQPTIGSEVASTLCTRDEYVEDKEKGYMSAYDLRGPAWGSTAESWWTRYSSRPWVAGGFVWTGFDYRGEPTPYQWPCISSHFGIMDSCGFPKDNFFYYKAWWGSEPVLHLFPHWNWEGKEGQPIDVWVHSNLDRVELFVNDASAGARNVKPNEHLSWSVNYVPGVIEARGFKDGRQVLTAKRETIGPAASIALKPDRAKIDANGEDVSVVEVQVTDQQGRVVPGANQLVAFKVSGPGKIIGVGNGDPSSHEADRAEQRSVFHGLCQVIVQTSKEPGTITLQAAAAGLSDGSVTIECAKAPARASV